MDKLWIVPAVALAAGAALFMRGPEKAQAVGEPLPQPRQVVRYKPQRPPCPRRDYWAEAATPMYEDEEPAWHPVRRRHHAQRSEGNVTTAYPMEQPDE
jgi:hypothetical protein